MSLKHKIINGIIEIEGGYVNDSSDSGGETNFGITLATALAFGYHGKMIYMRKEDAFNIYSKMYWDKLMLDDIELLSVKIAEEIADTGVNMGVGRAGRFLQRSLNVLNNKELHYKDLIVDGAIGRKTIVALKSYLSVRGIAGERVLFKALNCLQGAFYVELAERREKDERFVFGWFDNRVG